jgi:hypothetical protein
MVYRDKANGISGHPLPMKQIVIDLQEQKLWALDLFTGEW